MFRLAVWFGLMAGCAEAASVVVLGALHQCVLDLVSPFLWLIPITDALLLAVPGIVLVGLARFRISVARLGLVSFLFTFVLTANLIMAIGTMRQQGISWWAALLLAGGLAVQAKRSSERHPLGFYKWVVRSTVVILVGVALIAGMSLGHDMLNVRKLVAGIPPAAKGAPNVLLIVLDTVRAKSMSLYGYNRPTTPNLERWAKRGVVFDRAVSIAPFTLPSHASMFTGHYAQDLSTDWAAPLDRTYPTLAEVLYAHGYMTAGFVGNTESAGRQTGLDRGFVLYRSHLLEPTTLLKVNSLFRLVAPPPSHIGVEAKVLNEHFLDFLSRWQGHPFFAFLNYVDCHAPYSGTAPLGRPNEPYLARDRERLLRWTFESFRTPAAYGLELAHEAYEACLSELDRRVGALLEQLDQRGLLARTVVIIVADHGEQFGEHGLVQHADSLYWQLLHVPLIIINPGNTGGGRRVERMVSLRDLPATILDLVGLSGTKVPGDSFASLLTAPTTAETAVAKPIYAYVNGNHAFPAWHPNSSGPLRAVFCDDKCYIRGALQEELYDLGNDPEEERNLVEFQTRGLLLDRYRRLLASSMGDAGQPIAFGK